MQQLTKITVVTSLFIYSSALFAQESNEKNTQRTSRLLEEVVVTAQKREQNSQEVPISIQAFGGESLAAQGIETTVQLAQIVPSLQFTEAAGYTLIFMRGIGTDNFIPSADPSIAVYFDGIAIAQGHGAVQSLGNIERVEVLKGPQGSLFGRNATGGAISIVTKDPAGDLLISAEIEKADFDKETVKASISSSVTDYFAVGLDALQTSKDNYYRNVNYDIERQKLDVARLRMSFEPTDYLSLKLTGIQSKTQGAGSLNGNTTEPSALGSVLTPEPREDNYEDVTDFRSSTHSKHKILYGEFTWNLPWFDFKALAADQLVEIFKASIDFDGSSLPVAVFDAEYEFIDMKTYEIQFLSNEDSWGGPDLEWVAGLYYLESGGGFDPAHLRAGSQGVESLLNVAGVPNPGVLTNILNELPLYSTPLQDGGIEVEFAGVLGTKSYSVFAQANYRFNDFIELTIGGRYQTEDRFLTKSETGVINPLAGLPTIPLLNFELKSSTSNNFSPKAVVSIHPADDTMVYFSYATGFKSGTYNIVNIYTEPNYIEPEKVTSLEIGVKTDLFDGALRLNAAIYHNEIENLQSGFISLLSGGAVRFQTAGAAETKGVEFDTLWVPFNQWNPGFVVTANAAYVEANYTDFKDGSGFDPESGAYTEGLDFSGNEIVRAPTVSGGIGLSQILDCPKGECEFAIDGYYNSGFYYDSYNTVEEDEYIIANARVSYLYEPWNLRLTAFGKNLLDTRYHVQQLQTDFGVYKSLAAPVEYGFRLNWEY